MADAKTTKKAAPKKVTEVKDLKALEKELVAKRADYIETKKSHVAGELVNPRVITATRKEIARLMTAITAAKKSEKESK